MKRTLFSALFLLSLNAFAVEEFTFHAVNQGPIGKDSNVNYITEIGLENEKGEVLPVGARGNSAEEICEMMGYKPTNAKWFLQMVPRGYQVKFSDQETLPTMRKNIMAILAVMCEK